MTTLVKSQTPARLALHYLNWDGWAYDSDAVLVGSSSGINLLMAVYTAVNYNATMYAKYCTLICDYLGLKSPVDIVVWERVKSRTFADVEDVLNNIEK